MNETLLTLFLICLAVQGYFYFAVFIKLATYRKTEKNGKFPSVSVVIAARNEERNLPKLLKALSNQDHPKLEVIIVNDRSSDHSKEIVTSFAQSHSNVNLLNIETLPDNWNGKKYALYKGIQAAKNEVLLFTDGDCIPKSNHWASKIAKSFNEKTDIVLGYSPYLEKPGFLNQFIQFETLFVGIQYLSFGLWKKPYMGVGRNLAIRRGKYDLNLLKQISDTVGGDDDLMVNQLAKKDNVSIAIEPESHVVSIPERDWHFYFKQKIRHLSVGKHYRKKDKTLLGLFTLSFLLGWIIFFSLLVSANNPYLILAAFGLRSLSFYTIFARVGRKLEAPVNLWALPFLDLCYSIYYPLVGFRALSIKSIQWK